MATSEKRDLFENMPVAKALATLAVPTVISQIINLIYSVVDTFYIGRTGNSYMMASVTLAFTLYMMTVALANLFGIGGGSLMARLSGKHDETNARKVCSFSVYGAMAAAIAYSLFVLPLMNPILYLFGASSNTIGYAKQYVLLVVVLGNVPTILSMCLAHLMRNAGYSKQASIGLSGGGIMNIILDPILMFVILPKDMEVFGAALATLISNFCSFIFLFICMARVSKKAPVSVDVREIRGIRKSDVKDLFAVGVPSAVLTGLFDVANIFLNKLMANHGDLQLAAIGIVMKAERLPNAINIGICQGMLPLVAYNYTSGNKKRTNDTVRTARIYGLAISVVSVVLFSIFTKQIVGVFMNTGAGDIESAKATLKISIAFLQVRCIASPFQFLNYHSSFCMQAVGDGKRTLLHAIVRELVFYIPLMYLLDVIFGQTGLAIALAVGEAFGAVLALWLLRRSVKSAELQ